MLNQRYQKIRKKLKKNENGVSDYMVRDGLLYYMNHVYVPDVPGLRDEILHHFHNSKEGGYSCWLWTYVRMK